MNQISKVLILDFGSQYTQLIARRIREQNIYSEIHPYTMDFEKIKNDKSIVAIILSGGPNSIYDQNSPSVDLEIFKLGVPVLGICYGLQLMGHLLGGKVEAAATREYGRAVLEPDFSHPLFDSIPTKKPVNIWMSHGDHLIELPAGFKTIASTDNCPITAIANDEARLYGLQFHPEVVHSQYGDKILENFLFKIAKIKAEWTPKSYIQNQIEKIQEIVKDKKVLCGLSGGVDSSVAAVLIHKAIGDQLHCVFVDNGLLRKNERVDVEQTFKNNFKINLTVVDASEIFLSRLAGVTDPEQKRKIIGNTFIEVFETESKRLEESLDGEKFEFLAQGTLYPDVIESQSVGGPSHVIKSHHNVGGLPENMKFKLLEPLRELFKDEVREIGRNLGISEDIVGRHPFPGPGLGIRIIGDITKEKLHILKEADQIFIDELKNWKMQPESNTDFLYESSETKAGVAFEDYREAAHAIIYNPKIDKFLVIHNPSHSCSEKDFYFVGGKKDTDETSKETMIREVFEETGLSHDDTSKMFYYGKIKQTFYLRAADGFPEKNRTLISDIFYVETDSTVDGFSEKTGQTTKWVSFSELENDLLDGFKWVLQNCKANHSLYQQVWQAFCVLTEVKSIGVMGDGRTYENMLALRAVSAVDGMTADWSHLPYKFLGKVSNRIINEVKGINRVVYDISSKPPATIEWE
jgi:GMP synthase (glutamine-hydrolysing)